MAFLSYAPILDEYVYTIHVKAQLPCEMRLGQFIEQQNIHFMSS